MLVILWWKNDLTPTFLKSVETVREVREGLEVKCFGNEAFVHKNTLLSTYAIVKEPFESEVPMLMPHDASYPLTIRRPSAFISQAEKRRAERFRSGPGEQIS